MKPALLEANSVGKVFGRFTALRDVSARFEEGQLTAIIGPNGAGKSTFFNLLSGAFAPSSGSIRFAGQDITGMAQYRFARMGIAKSFQITNVFPKLDALENVRLAVQMRHKRLDFLSSRARLTQIRDEAHTLLQRVGLAEQSGKLARDMAHGQQRSLEIAMALACRPRLLLMDEPTAGMSPEETHTMMDLIAELATERTIILVEHKMKLVLGLCQRLLVLHHGEFLAEGTPDDIRANAEVRRVYLGQNA
jgi:branched-chain amino acid transport system ATP-binding protein